MKLNTKTSVVDYLKSNKKDSSFSNRTKIAQSYGINNYSGSAKQNTQLLGLLNKPVTQQTSNTKAQPEPTYK